MTATVTVQKEIIRFLRSATPEVVCISGDWGVGKTYTWHSFLMELQRKGEIALPRYSYASLFGINSLKSLKLTIFENLELFDASSIIVPVKAQARMKPALDFAAEMVPQSIRTAFRAALSRGARNRELAEALPAVGKFFSKAGALYFSSIRRQIICIDDIERRGSKLALRDVFGLVSFLREQRECKVMILLNEAKLNSKPVGSNSISDKEEFKKHLEKVVDAMLTFAPMPSEAADIALTAGDAVDELLKQSCGTLGIANIRVIKQIERLVRLILPHLAGRDPELLTQTVHSIALFGWSRFEPESAPPMELYKTSSVSRYFARKQQKEPLTEQQQRWETLLSEYKFTSMDEFDAALARFVETGVIEESTLFPAISNQEQAIERRKKTGSLDAAWRAFHDSFADNPDELGYALVTGTIQNSDIVSLSNLNAAVEVLCEIGRHDDAKALVSHFAGKKPSDFWDPSQDHFVGGQIHPLVKDVIDARQATIEAVTEASFDPYSALVEAGRTFDGKIISRLAELPIDAYYDIIRSRSGTEMATFVYAGLEFRRISNATPEMQEVVRKTEAALQKLATESPLNAMRANRFGIKAQP